MGLFLLLAGASACTHDAGTVAPAKTTDELVTGILTDMGPHVITPYYSDIDAQGKALNAAIKALVAAPTQANLLAAQAEWRTLRQYWEQSEAFLYGPTETDGFDPDIDTWPVNKADFDSLLATSMPFTMESIAGLQPSLKGFHPIEYILFGLGGTRQATALTARQKEFVSAQGRLSARPLQRHGCPLGPCLAAVLWQTPGTGRAGRQPVYNAASRFYYSGKSYGRYLRRGGRGQNRRAV